jgi:amino acid transporter
MPSPDGTIPSSPRMLDPADDRRLRELGYEPILSRRMSPFGNFAISFSIISILSGCMTLFGLGMNTGGPAVMVWGWIGVGALVLLVGLGLAEVTSAYPTSGGLFVMAERLGGKRWGWYTGWLNLLGMLGAIAGIDFGASQFIGALGAMRFNFNPTKYSLIGIYAIVLVVHGLLNMFGVRALDIFNRISAWWHLAGVALIVGALAIIPSHHQSATFVFAHFANHSGFSHPLYVSAVGLLLAGYTFSGYDASAHLSEETSQAATSAPRGIVRSIWVSWIAGLVLIVGMLFAVQKYDGESAAAVPPAQIFTDALGTNWAELLLTLVIVAQLFCGLAATGACARMVFAFSRAGALPGSKSWRTLNRRHVPARAVWMAVTIAFILALPSLWNIAAYGAVTAINVVGITPAYAIPIYLRVRQGKQFDVGPWNLGKRGVLIGVTAVVWVGIETILFSLPQSSPITALSFNYAPVALIVMLVLAWVWWMLRGREGYTTPTAVIEADTFANLDVI